MIILPEIGWTDLDGRWLYKLGSNNRSYYKIKGANRIYSEKEYKRLTVVTISSTFRDKYKHTTWRW